MSFYDELVSDAAKETERTGQTCDELPSMSLSVNHRQFLSLGLP